MHFKTSAFITVLLTGAFFPAVTRAEQPLSLEIHGLTRGYIVYHNQSEAAGQSARAVELLRDTEIELEGSTRLANGTEIGVVIELTGDREAMEGDKSYLYAKTQTGRIDFGVNNGVAYRLQVSPPAADSNIDGPRQYIRTVNYSVAPATFAPLARYDLEYAHDTSASTDKLSYITPAFSGFQLGVSYTPDSRATSYAGHQESTASSRSLNGVNTDNILGEYGSAYDLAARYETTWQNLDLSLGAGYVGVRHERKDAAETDLHSWNAGANLGYRHLRLGASYTENDNGQRADRETRIWVLGASYEAGPWYFGGSYYNRADDNFSGGNALDTNRYSLGTAYEYGPGMSLRGSVHHIEHDVGNADMDATSWLLGTQVNF